MLNASYEPIKVVNWQKAVVLWFQGKVDILEHHNVSVKSVSQSFQLPSIIRLRRYVRNYARSVVRFSRENIYLRDLYLCQYCHQKFQPKDLTLDHVVPASKGGKKSWTNVVAACRKCNQKKGNKTPDQAMMPLLKRPEVPKWLPDPQRLDLSRAAIPDSWKIYLYLEDEILYAGSG